MKCLMCKEREALEGGVYCKECEEKVLNRVRMIREAKEDKELKKTLAYVYNRTLQILKCDICGCWYLGKFNEHNINKPNVCCASCAWVLEHDEGAPRPPHTCKQIADAWLQGMKRYSCLVWHCRECATLNCEVNIKHPIQCSKCEAKP